MKLEDRLVLSIARRPGDVFLRCELATLGGASQITAALTSLRQRGLIIRIGRGAYAKARLNPVTHAVEAVQDATSLARQVARKKGLIEKERPVVHASKTRLFVHRRALRVPKTGLAQYVTSLARRLHVGFERTYGDDWAESVTRLAGDSVKTDHIEDLVVAMKRAGKINGADMVKMLGSYLDEKQRAL